MNSQVFRMLKLRILLLLFYEEIHFHLWQYLKANNFSVKLIHYIEKKCAQSHTRLWKLHVLWASQEADKGASRIWVLIVKHVGLQWKQPPKSHPKFRLCNFQGAASPLNFQDFYQPLLNDWNAGCRAYWPVILVLVSSINLNNSSL